MDAFCLKVVKLTIDNLFKITNFDVFNLKSQLKN